MNFFTLFAAIKLTIQKKFKRFGKIQTKYAANCDILSLGTFGLPRFERPPLPLPRPRDEFMRRFSTALCFSILKRRKCLCKQIEKVTRPANVHLREAQTLLSRTHSLFYR